MNADEHLDHATAARLAKLGAMPVDTSRLDAMIRSEIPSPHRSTSWRIRPLRAVAAAVALLAMMGIVFWSLSGGAVYASPDAMVQFHEDLVSKRVHAIEVDSIAAANKALAAQWTGGVELPRVPDAHAMMCCMRSIEDKRVACVLMTSDGVPVTMAVAKAMDMKMPRARTITDQGITYHVQSSGKLNMVMAERGGRWICLIGELSPDKLIRSASAIEF